MSLPSPPVDVDVYARYTRTAGESIYNENPRVREGAEFNPLRLLFYVCEGIGHVVGSIRDVVRALPE